VTRPTRAGSLRELEDHPFTFDQHEQSCVDAFEARALEEGRGADAARDEDQKEGAEA
jgi:hypothetical protein